jgi:hypothetical protein
MGHPSDFLRPLLQHRLLGTEFGDEFVRDGLTSLLRKLQLVPSTSKVNVSCRHDRFLNV